MFIFLLVTALTAFDAKMSDRELQKTGVSRLSLPEKKALHEWIEEHYEKKVMAQNQQKEPQLQENLNNGSLIRLTDNTLWKIAPKDTPVTQGWITQVEIKISKSEDENYPFLLTNSLTGSSVKAQKVPI
ncbi:MAG: hypothetical protein A3D96_02660 [Chlamydiae bacterium RIFCSPHIGHO2_12_FULL_44_59]|nr:MAG: hypothetical protein A2796_07010 [Chlamydiae bacterium RIFCSPHIGHO2_01_FULL_44_39]OGN59181.1 MAG: hypothetical protein A3C42_01390 [Chlamydiae bacterium RIFCSPHIGHO2_02_FULL_45_9]OGN60986.1 MAG: hypothetical protein A3D96_02660 [Chlamydiae bacterium RIFCSPHIGHO2_12_FULL_44_59]OGN66762.1 MAG: hypothetical protein A2978_00145 [Chlamydiae bacterium RIFCSPLOWO2_01_FULL_44_52]OGN69956.1 MAG: hypothetical protein A3I67_01460 [Chlamydiae bacterium RIFCSPLOWO2_02_FULL_45_22]OGN71027.1 MAG: hyp